jgi:class 3 adenylate cyclase
MLYADVDGSTAMVDTKDRWFCAERYKTFLHRAAKIIKARNGVITVYDGNRIMALFIGDNKCTNAITSALQINNAVLNAINPGLKVTHWAAYKRSVSLLIWRPLLCLATAA